MFLRLCSFCCQAVFSLLLILSKFYSSFLVFYEFYLLTSPICCWVQPERLLSRLLNFSGLWFSLNNTSKLPCLCWGFLGLFFHFVLRKVRVAFWRVLMMHAYKFLSYHFHICIITKLTLSGCPLPSCDFLGFACDRLFSY